MINYSSVLQTGLQSLLAVGCGWSCGKWRILEAEPTVHYTNTLVLKFCIPCLQVWLLAIKTDMRQPGNWSALGVFLLWSLTLQLLLALQQLVTSRRLKLAKLGIDSLLLTTNNTGILGPVVIQAAVGSKFAPLGMLATVVLYFQQLPSAQLLFQLQQQQDAADAATTGSTSPGKQQYNGVQWDQQRQYQHDDSSGDLCSSLQQLELIEQRLPVAAAQLVAAAVGKPQKDHASPAPLTPVSAAAAALQGLSLADGHHHPPTQAAAAAASTSAGGLQYRRQHAASADSLQTHYQQQHSVDQQVLYIDHSEISPAGGADSPLSGYNSQQQQQQWETAVLLGPASRQLPQQQQQQWQGQQGGVLSMVASLLIKNSLVWSTGISLLLSCVGSSAVLDPGSPSSIKQLAFFEQMLQWFAVSTAPLTLFTTGLWMYSNNEKQQQLLEQQHGALLTGRHRVARLQQAEQLSWKGLAAYLLARATIAPGLMVMLCYLLGCRGDLAHALVILALLPVAQTAFVVCKQHETGMHAVSCVMVGSLLLMLPQLMVMLAVLEHLQVFA